VAGSTRAQRAAIALAQARTVANISAAPPSANTERIPFVWLIFYHRAATAMISIFGAGEGSLASVTDRQQAISHG
jgi:hypothetical protein